VDEEESQYIHVLLFSVLLDNCNEKSEYRNKTVLKKKLYAYKVLFGNLPEIQMK